MSPRRSSTRPDSRKYHRVHTVPVRAQGSRPRSAVPRRRTGRRVLPAHRSGDPPPRRPGGGRRHRRRGHRAPRRARRQHARGARAGPGVRGSERSPTRARRTYRIRFTRAGVSRWRAAMSSSPCSHRTSASGTPGTRRTPARCTWLLQPDSSFHHRLPDDSSRVRRSIRRRFARAGRECDTTRPEAERFLPPRGDEEPAAWWEYSSKEVCR